MDFGGNNKFNKKKVRSIPIVTLIAIAIVTLVVMRLVDNYTIGKIEHKVLQVNKKIAEDKIGKYTFTVKADGKTGVDELDDLLIDSSVKIKAYFDREKLEGNFEMALIVDEDEVVEVNVGVTNETMFVEFPEVYDKCFYQKIDSSEVEIIWDCINLYKCSEGEIFNILSKDKYKDVIVEMVEENTDDEGVLTLKVKDIVQLAENLVQVAENDDEIAREIYKSMEVIAKNLEGCEFKSNEAKELVDEFSILVKEYDEEEVIEELKYGIESLSDEFEDMTDLEEFENYEIKIDFNSDTSDKIDIAFEVEGIDIIVGIESGKGASKPNYKGDLDLETSQDQLEEVQAKIGEAIVDNDKIRKVLFYYVNESDDTLYD